MRFLISIEKGSDYLQELLYFFQKVNFTYWGNYFFRFAFYTSIFIILFLARNKSAKVIYVAYPIIFLALFYSPIGYQLAKYFLYGMWEYYCRLYSMIPVLYCIAFGAVLLLNKIKGTVK